jgi:hypothetical protein
MNDDQQAKQCKVHFNLERAALDEATPWPPYVGESLWAEMVTDTSARLDNIPFYAKGVSYLDEVRLEDYQPDSPDAGEAGPMFYEYVGVLKHSGHGTVRAILNDDEKFEIANSAIDDVIAMGCRSEGAGMCISIDIPPDVDSSRVMAILKSAEAAGAIFVDVGFLPAAD